jgi:hypothetical protein
MQEIKEGSYVHYVSPHGGFENGRVKSIRASTVFVVYNCDDEWENYKQYTGAGTYIEAITLGWVDKDGKPIDTPDAKKNQACDHHYIPTNAKWQSVTQRQCCHCGHIID